MKKFTKLILCMLVMAALFAGCIKTGQGEGPGSDKEQTEEIVENTSAEPEKEEPATVTEPTTEEMKPTTEEAEEPEPTTEEVTEEVKPTTEEVTEEAKPTTEEVTEEVKPTTEETEKPEPATEEEAEEQAPVVLDDKKAVSVWTTASSLNVRKNPNTSAGILKVLLKGTEIKKYEEKDGWALIKSGDTIGYVSVDYISSKKPEPATEEKKEETTKVEAIPGQHKDPNNAVIVIDPGHQRKGDSTKEPNGPGSSEMKARVTYGATGVATGVAEYEMNLEVSLKLKEELENRGYTVYMTRTTHDVNISNKERAQYGNKVKADAAIRIHGNSAQASVRGAETLAPSSSNPYVSHLAKASQNLSKHVINEYCKATGFLNRGVKTNDTMTGINWSEIPVTIIELGFMSNEKEDRLMQDANMQNNMVQGIANGIDKYFGF